nr:HDOD domain-containing protein [Bryobacter sp.]
MPSASVRVRFDALPPFSPVLGRILPMLADDSLNYRALGETISADPSLTAQVLRLANSALFGRRGEIRSLFSGLTMLGVDRVYSLVLTSGLKRMASRAARWPAARRIWRHSLATALLSADMTLDHFGDMAEDYTAGLLHDLGRFILLMTDPEAYSQLLERAAQEGSDSRRLEALHFGISHEEAGAEAMRRYGFPESLREVAAHHHDPARSSRAERHRVELISCCSQTASLCGFFVVGPEHGPQEEEEDDDLSMYLKE